MGWVLGEGKALGGKNLGSNVQVLRELHVHKG